MIECNVQTAISNLIDKSLATNLFEGEPSLSALPQAASVCSPVLTIAAGAPGDPPLLHYTYWAPL